MLDEPVSALDVSIQAQVLNLLRDLQEEFGLTYLFIANNLNVVEYLSDRVAVLHRGRIVELAPAADLYAEPRHPHTRELLSAVLSLDRQPRQQRTPVEISAPPASGCHYRHRCPIAKAICAEAERELRVLGGAFRADPTPTSRVCP